MKTWSRSSHLLLKLMYMTLLPVLDAQQLQVLPEVTGYLGHDVTLPCQLIDRKQADLSQGQWDLLQPDGNKSRIIVFSSQHGVDIPESPLKGRVEVAEQSLIIRNVEMADAGSYTCSLTTFPSGSFEGTTILFVQEKPLSTGTVAAIVTVVVLLLVIMAAVVYLIFIRRCNSSDRHRVFIDTARSVKDVTRPSLIVKEDVVYSDVHLKPSRDVTPSSSDKQGGAVRADDVTYSEVVVLRQQPKRYDVDDEVLSYVC